MVIRVDAPSHPCAAGDDGTGGGGGGIVAVGEADADGVAVVAAADGVGVGVDAGSGRNSAKAKTPPTAKTTTAASAIATTRPACTRRGRDIDDEARGIGTFRTGCDDPTVRHDLETAEFG
jgi:hypothetical protein